MSLRTVSSKTNPLIKYAVKLHDKAFRDEEKAFIFEGEKLLFEALRAEIPVKTLIMCSEFADDHMDLCNKYDCVLADCEILKKITKTQSPQGVAVIAEKPELKDFSHMPAGKYMALENVSDPQNVGALIRSCHALGLSGVLLSLDCADPFSIKSIRASMGSLFHLPAFYCKNMAKAVNSLKESGFHIYAAALDKSAVSTANAVFSDSQVVVIGNESSGVSKETLDSAEALYIEMKGNAESLNAAVAGSIIAYCMTEDKRW